MGDKIQAIRGMNDLLPVDTQRWQQVEEVFRNVLSQYGYGEIRTPILESTHLFKRSIGEVTDIVEKEMYTFDDLNGDSLSLRPEGTASVVRAAIEHGLLHNQQQKLWYQGPMFRHERPQKGRYRQFNQLGIEAYGFDGPEVVLEQLQVCQRLWTALGIDKNVHLEVNTIGTVEERNAYKSLLVDYFESHISKLDADSQCRLHRNPLRILDSKNPDMRDLIDGAPKLIDQLHGESADYFDLFCQGLDALGIPYCVNNTLVRGLDYYSQVVFEWVTDKLGSQATICAGGRYDALVRQLGGKEISAVGFALGVERLILLMEACGVEQCNDTHGTFGMFICDGAAARLKALSLAEQIRNAIEPVNVLVVLSGGSFKSQFKKADKSGARFAFVIGEDELENKTVGIKSLRAEFEQLSVEDSKLSEWCLQQMMD